MNNNNLASALSCTQKEDFQFHSQLSDATTTAQLKIAVVRAVGILGLDCFNFTPVGIDNTGRLSNWPEQLKKQYCQYIDYDLVNRHAETQTSPVFQSTIEDYIGQSPLHLESNERYLHLCKLAKEHGWIDSYNIPYSTPIGINCLFAVSKLHTRSGDFRKLIDEHQPMLYLLGDILTNMATARFAPYFFGPKAFIKRAGVTPRQVNLLNILAKNNVNLIGAAKQLHISLDTANKHMAAIKNALGAKTQASAVYRAIATGLIDIGGGEWK